MRFPIAINAAMSPLFRVFGFSRKSSWLELDDQALTVSYGTAHETIPLSDIASVKPGKWPFYYGYGAKLTPQNGIGFVGSGKGIVDIQFKTPRRFNVWGPFKRKQAEHLTVSLEDAEGFMQAYAERG